MAAAALTRNARLHSHQAVRHVQRFRTLRQRREPTPEIALTPEGAAGLIIVDAAQLVAQYETASRDILLILDEDCPYEEQVHLALVRDDAVADHIVIGAPYATGAFRELSTDGDVLRFNFNGDDVWRVEVRTSGSRMPEPLPPGAKRRNGWFALHYLSLILEQPA